MNRAGGALVYSIADIVLAVLEWLILGWVILSWVIFFASRSSWRWRYRGFYLALEAINGFLSRALRPVLLPFRKLLPPWKTGGIDWSPLLLLLAVYLLRIILRMALL